MNPSNTDQLIKFVTDTLQQGKDLVIDQAPTVVKEFLRWNFYQDLFWIGVGLATILTGTIIYYKLKKSLKGTMEYGFQFVPGAVGWIIGTVAVAINLFDLIKLLVAPRIYLIEYVTSLLRGRS